MDCVNHSGVQATAYCQNCGKALCTSCVRNGMGGQVLCEPCWMAWQSMQNPFVAAPPGAPNPGLAAVLGLIPGVGAMYNGQFIKGLIHVVIFAVLVSAAHLYGIFGFFIAGWVFYQVFEAYHTAKARRDGLPLPDPLGLNEVGSWFNMGNRPPGAPPAAGSGAAMPGSYPPGYAGTPQPPFQVPYQPPYQPPYQGAGFPPAPPVPPVPPVSPGICGGREPIAAIVLIALGVLFLLGQLDIFSGRVMEYAWPVLLIGLGGWLMVRRLQDTRFPPPGPPQVPPQAPPPPGNGQQNAQGGSQ